MEDFDEVMKKRVHHAARFGELDVEIANVENEVRARMRPAPRRVAPRRLALVAVAAVLIGALIWVPGRGDDFRILATGGGSDDAEETNGSAGETHGLVVDLSVPSSAMTGDPVEISVAVSDSQGMLEGPLVLALGDGTGYVGDAFGVVPDQLTGDQLCDEVAGEGRRMQGTMLEKTYEHAYRQPGTYTVSVAIATGDPCGDRGIQLERREAIRQINVEGDDDPATNGPRQPTIQIGDIYGTKGAEYVEIDVAASDADGFVSRLEIDWGDGTAPDIIDRGLEGCRDEGTSWPHSTFSTGEVRHIYEERGRYTLTVIAASVGCDGRYAQRTTASREISYPPRVILPDDG